MIMSLQKGHTNECIFHQRVLNSEVQKVETGMAPT